MGFEAFYCFDDVTEFLTLFEKNVFDHCSQTLRREKLKLGDFKYPWRIKKSYFGFPRLSGVTIATKLSGSTPDFLKLSSHTLLYHKILKAFKSKL